MSATTNERRVETGGRTQPAVAADELREQAVESLKRKRRFARDLISYVTVNGILWVIWAVADRSVDGSVPWPAWVSMVWGFFLVLDAWKAFGTRPQPITESDVDREMERLSRR